MLVHSDFRGFDFTDFVPPDDVDLLRESLVNFAFRKLDLLVGERTVLLPAFNYDFTSTGVFDVARDLPQVGRLPVAAIGRPGWSRDRTPVFSFVSRGGKTQTYPQPFSENSTFAELISQNGEILLLGVGCERLTFLHHLEHLAEISYRYSKKFVGVYKESSGLFPAEVEFHVRPIGVKVEYDFARIEAELFRHGVAKQLTDRVISINPVGARDVILEILARDSLWLLAPDSRRDVELNLERLGRRFLMEDFE